MNETFHQPGIQKNILHAPQQLLGIMLQFWRARNPREKIILWVGGMVIVGSAIWAWGIAPAIDVISQQPVREAQLLDKAQKVSQAAMQLQAIQAQNPTPLKPNVNTAASAENVQELIKTLLHQHQLQSFAAIRSETPGQLNIQFNAAPAQQLLQWILACEQLHLNIQHFDLNAKAGQLSGRLIVKLRQNALSP